VSDASAAYSKVFHDGLILPDLAANVAQAHMTFRQSCGVAHAALATYKTSGSMESLDQYNLSLNTARQSAQWYLALIYPVLQPQDAADLSTRLKNATEP